MGENQWLVRGAVYISSCQRTGIRIFQIALKRGGGFLPQWRKSFLLGGGNLRSGFDSFSKLKTTFCQYWTSIKIKISMTCMFKEYEVYNGIRVMTTTKMKFLVCYNMEIVIWWEGINLWWARGIKVWWEEGWWRRGWIHFWLVGGGGGRPHPSSRENHGYLQ